MGGGAGAAGVGAVAIVRAAATGACFLAWPGGTWPAWSPSFFAWPGGTWRVTSIVGGGRGAATTTGGGAGVGAAGGGGAGAGAGLGLRAGFDLETGCFRATGFEEAGFVRIAAATGAGVAGVSAAGSAVRSCGLGARCRAGTVVTRTCCTGAGASAGADDGPLERPELTSTTTAAAVSASGAST